MRNQNLVSQLMFLDPVYHHEHHKGKPHSHCPLLNESWLIPTQVLKENLYNSLARRLAVYLIDSHAVSAAKG